MPICWSIGPSYFCGLCLKPAARPDGVWIEAAQGGQWLGPWTLPYFLAVFIIRQSTVVWVIYEFEKEVVEGRLSPGCYNRWIQYGCRPSV